MRQFQWKIGGEAGFGILTSGIVFSKIVALSGYFVFDSIQYPSLIRGGHNTYDVCFSDEPVYSLKESVDFLVCLNKETYDLHKDKLTKDAYILYDSADFKIQDNAKALSIPFSKILTDLKGQTIMKNTIALGATLALLGANLEYLNAILYEQFARKGDEVVNFNKQFAQAGYDYVMKQFASLVLTVLKPQKKDQLVVMTGNEAFSLGAVLADCRMYVAYPMTPASTVLGVLAGWQTKTGMVVRHAEDEIAAINTALGGAYAGVRSATGSSGGGFALMVEAISLAGITEIPIVVFLSQRPGPATGMPTWTEQGDLLFAVNAGHGEFPKIVLAPGDAQEMVDLTIKAFDLADIYQTPVLVLSDMWLSESHGSFKKEYIEKLQKEYKPNYGKLTKEGNVSYKRYADSTDGISQRLIPGAKGVFYQANSYEHLEDGHTTESSVERIKQVEKRTKKQITYLKNHFEGPAFYGDQNAEIVFVSWGSPKGAIIDAQRQLADMHMKTGFYHFHHVFPLNKEQIQGVFNKEKKYILVENNSEAQFGKLLQQETGIEIKEKILKYNGRSITREDIVSYIQKNK